jgi:hypothetical protein
MKALLSLLAVLFININSFSQALIRWDFENQGSFTTSPTYVDLSINAYPVWLSEVYLYNYMDYHIGPSGNQADKAISANGWMGHMDWGWTDFYGFYFDVDSGETVRVDSMSFWHRKSFSGPRLLHVRSSFDSFESPLDSSEFFPEAENSWHRWKIDSEALFFDGPCQVHFRIYANGALQTNQAVLAVDSVALWGEVLSTKRVQIRAMLDGPYDQALGLMSDSLRYKELLPLSDPYGYGKVITEGVRSVSGQNAIVDWVLVEFRSQDDSSLVLDSEPLLIQRDGDVVSLDGVSFPVLRLEDDSFYVSIRHRNHLGVITALPVNSDSVIDFTLSETACMGFDSRVQRAGVFCLWAGDVNSDNIVQYTGQGNDRDLVLYRVGGVVPTSTEVGYLDEDLNMDGLVKYTGSFNDRDIILLSVGGVVPTNTREGGVP